MNAHPKTPNSICLACIAAAAFAAMPAAAQLGLGRATGSVSGTVQGTVSGTVAQPIGKAGGTLPGNEPGQSLTGSLRATNNAALSTQLNPLLPPSTSLPAAAAGFHDDSEFLAALHASHNLNIPFDQLKARTTGKGAVSLDSAVHKLRPDLDGKAVKSSLALAQRQSDRDMQQAAMSGSRDKVSSRIVSNDRLSARLNPLVPEGQTLGQAAAGFKNEDQFMSTLHASHDNGIAFGDLKDRVTAGQSLSEAIHEMKPDMDQKASASASAHAEAQSKDDKVKANASANAKANISAR